jgi:two-component system chemotaxis response regulator CheY
MRALIVDDSRSMRMILSKTLRELGFQIAEAGDGQEALNRLNQGEQVELMLVDWNMPVMNGYELICAVRANILLDQIRIMMVTTETSMTNVESALAAGANEYLMKPFTKELLLEKLALLGIN